MQFIDEATIEVGAGKGGDGIIAWRREKYVPMGGPAGGDGGVGGDVVILADPELNTLVEFRFKKVYAAESGENGGTSNKSGKSRKDLIIPVPVGTLVYKLSEGGEICIADMREEGQRVIVARGGRGGLGNQHFATSKRQAPRFAEKGAPGEHVALRLELKLLADCGLVGVPNAGKSTLLAAVSAAKPKIADYPFTTLEPQLGVVRVDEESSFVMVDIPGLIEGAHEGAGLGDRFLRHVERTRVLIHLLDGQKSIEDILADKSMIEDELRAWNAALLDRPRLLVITKMDLPDARERFEELRVQFPELRAISAAAHDGVRDLVFAAWQTIQATPLPEVAAESAGRIELKQKEIFSITLDDDGIYVIAGERIERLAAMTDFDNDEALGRFERILAKLGVEKRLRDLGVAIGDTVRIGENEFTYN